MADLAPMDQDEDTADGPPDDGVDILEEAAPDEDEAKPDAASEADSKAATPGGVVSADDRV